MFITIDDEDYTLKLAHPSEAPINIQNAKDLEVYKNLKQSGFFIDELEIVAYFNSGSLTWTNVDGEWQWA